MEHSTAVLVVGAGPVGLTTALELARHGASCRIIDRLPVPSMQCKAIGVQPRTIEMWDDMGLARDAIDAGIWLRGQIVFKDGSEVARTEIDLPGIPYSFLGLPQYEVERILEHQLAGLGIEVERGVELDSFTQHDDRVDAALRGRDGDRATVRTAYLVGCDGAHSKVREQLGLEFEGDRFAPLYMLGDVQVRWSIPHGFAVRFLGEGTGDQQDVLVCVPLPGHHRYRLSMLAPPAEAAATTPADEVAHGFRADRPAPTLGDIKRVVDRLAPPSTVVSDLRWSSLFGISHRIVDRYASGRVFVCGDAAHIHPPTGAQGANTGMQDGYNLAWKLALAVQGRAAPQLLDSYDAERRPVGEEVVGRTVRHAESQYQDEPQDDRQVLLREGQLLVNYVDSSMVDDALSPRGGPAMGLRPGERVPDVTGLARHGVGAPLRLFDLTRGPSHVLLLADHGDGGAFGEMLRVLRDQEADLVRGYMVTTRDDEPDDLGVPLIRDHDGRFGPTFGVTEPTAYLVRPDGYLGFRGPAAAANALRHHLGKVLA